MTLGIADDGHLFWEVKGSDGGQVFVDRLGPDRTEVFIVAKDGREYACTLNEQETQRFCNEMLDALNQCEEWLKSRG